MIEAVSQTPKQEERGNLPTLLDVNSCLTYVLEANPNTLVAKWILTLFNDS